MTSKLEPHSWQLVQEKRVVGQAQAEKQLQHIREKITKLRLNMGSWFDSNECTSSDTQLLAWVLDNFDLIWRGDANGIERAKIISEVNKAQNADPANSKPPPPIRLVSSSRVSEGEVRQQEDRKADDDFPPE